MYKFLLSVVAIFAITATTNAQQFFKRMPKPVAGRSITGVTTPTEQYVFRPVLNVASYAIGDNSLLNGGGVAYQFLKYDPTTEKWTSVWSVNMLTWYKTSFSGDGQAFAAGLSVGFFNNLIMIGGGKSFANIPGNSGFFGTIGFGINFNN
jgi:hypothetical protein